MWRLPALTPPVCCNEASNMSVTLPCRRVVDGAALAGFATTWRQYVESPGRLLLHLR